MRLDDPGWCLVVPIKRLELAKSRLAGPAAPHRQELALAFAVDTVEAAMACAPVLAVVTVTDDAAAARAVAAVGATLVADEPDAGLNPALRHGVTAAVALHPGARVGSLSADLPALRPAELADALAEAAHHDVSFVRDRAGTGTTVLLAGHAEGFVPHFGAGSAGAHVAAGATELTSPGLDSMRHDVDTVDDLVAAAALGLGPRTVAAARRLGLLGPGAPGG